MASVSNASLTSRVLAPSGATPVVLNDTMVLEGGATARAVCTVLTQALPQDFARHRIQIDILHYLPDCRTATQFAVADRAIRDRLTRIKKSPQPFLSAISYFFPKAWLTKTRTGNDFHGVLTVPNSPSNYRVTIQCTWKAGLHATGLGDAERIGEEALLQFSDPNSNSFYASRVLTHQRAHRKLEVACLQQFGTLSILALIRRLTLQPNILPALAHAPTAATAHA